MRGLTVDAIVAILRDYEMHEPQCPYRQREKAQAGTGVWLTPAECNCWLQLNDGPESVPTMGDVSEVARYLTELNDGTESEFDGEEDCRRWP